MSVRQRSEEPAYAPALLLHWALQEATSDPPSTGPPPRLKALACTRSRCSRSYFQEANQAEKPAHAAAAAAGRRGRVQDGGSSPP